jgi:hypothetical protein
VRLIDDMYVRHTMDCFRREEWSGTPKKTRPTKDIILPELLAVVLRQSSMFNIFVSHVSSDLPTVWLLRDNNIEDYAPFLDQFLSLPHSFRTKVGGPPGSVNGDS